MIETAIREPIPGLAWRFSRSATAYHNASEVHAEIAATVAAMATTCPSPRRVLDVGCGTGHLLRHLVRFFPEAEIDAVDLSEDMLKVARTNLEVSPQIAFHCADIRDFLHQRLSHPGESHSAEQHSYDLIVSASAIQWIRPLSSLFVQCSAALATGGIFILAAMTDGTFSELRSLRAKLFPAKPLHYRLPMASEISLALEQAHFTVSPAHETTYAISQPSAWELVRMINRLGFSAGSLSSAQNALTRAELSQLCATYAQEYSTGLCEGPNTVLASYVSNIWKASK